MAMKLHLSFSDPTNDRTITFPDATITVNAAGDLTGTSLASNIVGSILTNIGILSSLIVSGNTNFNDEVSLGDDDDDIVIFNGTIAPFTGNSHLVFEGATEDGDETTFVISDPTTDRTITFPNATLTVNEAGDLTGTSLASNVVSSDLTSVGTLSSLTVSGSTSLIDDVFLGNSAQ